MTEENTAEAAGNLDMREAIVTQPGGDTPSQERDFEKEARAAGWVPEAEFKGEKRPAVFVDAKTFVERGEELIPFIRKENRELKEKIGKIEADYAKRFERMEKVNAKTFEAEKGRYEAEIARLKREQRAAAAEGDVERFDELEVAKASLKAPEPIEVPQTEPVDPGAVFKKDNPWYGEDEDLTAYADGISQSYLAKHPNASLEENLRHTAEKVKAAFPAKFKKPAVNGHAAVDSGGDFPSAAPKQSSLAARLPAEAKAQAERDIKAGLYKNVDAWAKVYFGN